MSQIPIALNDVLPCDGHLGLFRMILIVGTETPIESTARIITMAQECHDCVAFEVRELVDGGEFDE